MATELRTGAAAPRPAFYNDPKIRGLFYQLLALALVVAGGWYLIGNTLENRARLGVASGFGFLGRTVRVRHLADAHPLQLEPGDLRHGLHRRPAQHVLCRHRRHRAGYRHRLYDRHSAAFVQLARAPAGVGLCRDRSQHPAAAAADLLVLGRARLTAGPSRRCAAPGRRAFLNVRGLYPAPADIRAGLRLCIVVYLGAGDRRSSCCRTGRGVRQRTHGPAIPDCSGASWRSSSSCRCSPSSSPASGHASRSPVPQRFNFVGGSCCGRSSWPLRWASRIYTGAFIAEIVRSGILAVHARAVGGGWRSGLRPDADPAADRRAAGTAGHHPAADEPVSEPHQELLACRGDRLSRLRSAYSPAPSSTRPDRRSR